MPTVAPRLALWGTFDVDNYGDHLFPLVAGHELRRRLPGAAVDFFSPFGHRHPTRLDGPPVAPLGPPTPGRLAAFAAGYDAVLVGGGEIIHLNDPILAPVYGVPAEEMVRMAPSRFFVEGLGPGLEGRCPVLWHAVGVPFDPTGDQAGRLRAALERRSYVAVRDRFSRERLERAGVETAVAVVPDSALLLDRVLPAALLGARLERLRAQGFYPAGPAVAIQGCDLLQGQVADLGAVLRAWLDAHPAAPAPVVLETGRCRGDAAFAGALAPLLGERRVYRLPSDSTVADLAAALFGAEIFVGSSLHGAITALVYGRPFVLLNLGGESKLDGFADLTGLEDCVVHDVAGLVGALGHGPAAGSSPPADLLAAMQRRVDAHFDRVAGIARAGATARPGRRLTRLRPRPRRAIGP